MAQPLIGLDIGYQHVRAVALRAKGRQGYELTGHACVNRFDDLGQRKPLEVSIAEIDSRLPLKGDLTVGASDLAVMVRFEHNDPMPPDRMERVLRLELSQHSGLGSEDMAADAVAIPLGGDSVIHCCGLAQPPQVLALLEDLRKEKIQAARVHLAPAGLANLGRSLPIVEEADAGTYDLLVDIGAHYTRVVLMRDGDFIACRQLQVGGDTFSEHLAQELGIRFEDAERRKLDPGIDVGEDLRSDAAATPAVRSLDAPAPIFGDDLQLDLEEDAVGDTATVGPVLSLADDSSGDRPAADGGLVLDDDSSGDRPAADIGLMLDDDSSGDRPAVDFGLDAAGEDELVVVDESDVSQPAPGEPTDDPFAAGVELDLDGPLTQEGFEPVDPEPPVVPQLPEDESTAEQATPLPAGTGSLAVDDDLTVVPAAQLPPPAAATSVPYQRTGRRPLELDEPAQPGKQTVTMAMATLGPQFHRAAEDLFVQVSKTVSWFQIQLKVRKLPLRRVWLSGGGADLHGLPAYLRRRFGKPVDLLDDLEPLVTGLPGEGGHCYAQAVGLALAGRPGAVSFDLRPESLQRQQLMRQVVFWPRLATVLLVVAAGATGYGIWSLSDTYDRHIAAYEQMEQRYQQLNGQVRKLRGHETALKEDLRTIASRIFAGRDLLSTIRALKMHAPESLWITEFWTEGIGAAGGVDPSGKIIGRGSLFLKGYVKPDPTEEHAVWFGKILAWKDAVLAYRTEQKNEPLFIDFEFIQEHWDPPPSDGREERIKEEGERWFIIRFDYRPTALDEWVTDEGRP